MSLRQQLVKTATAYVDAHNSRDSANILALCTPSCVHRSGPVSVKAPDRDNDGYGAFNTEVFKMLHTYHAAISDMVADAETRKVVIFLHAKATADAGEYENEYVHTITTSEDGKMVQDCYGFVDSLTMVQWITKMGEYAKDTWENK